MPSKLAEQAEELFHAALAYAPADRGRYLDTACESSAPLRDEVESLLTAHDTADGLLDTPAAEHLTGFQVVDAGEDCAGRKIGSYALVRCIGAGGMGTVYEAIQEKPRRTVALKVLNTGLTSEASLRRFQYESQILARLRHPGIAQVYEAGTHGNGGVGVPFFAMEYVPDAQSVTRFADAAELDLPARLALLRQVCDAVQHAHQHGVIHRDLKPGNILVDSTGQAKVIDFGVARVTDQDVAPTTLRTDLGQLIGTLPYMSPEQVAGDSDAVDTRCDVYALGVIGYELLCGKLPLDLRNRAIPDAVRMIRDEDPTPLSSMNRVFRGDLDTILGKALEKDKTRRYQSVSDLAADIDRYLSNDPILARPASAGYQLRKFARRNRALFVGLTVAVLGLLGGTSVAVWKAVEASHERDNARIDAISAIRISKFLQSILESAASQPADPDGDYSLRHVLDAASLRVQDELGDDPDVEASIRQKIGHAYLAIGDLDSAGVHLQAAWQTWRTRHGDGNKDSLCILNDLVKVWVGIGEHAKAESTIRDTLPKARKELGTGHEYVTRLEAHLAELRGLQRDQPTVRD